MNNFEEEINKENEAQILRVGKSVDNSLEKAINKKIFDEKERENLSKKGQALPDGSFPIRNTQDLKDAVKSIGRAKDYGKARSWIIKRARALGKLELLPEDWSIHKSMSLIKDAFEAGSISEEMLEKAMGHKYFKREGTPGKYKYYYTEKEYKEAKGVKGDKEEKVDSKENLLKERKIIESEIGKNTTSVGNHQRFMNRLEVIDNKIRSIENEDKKKENVLESKITLDTFKDLANKSKDVKEFMSKVREIKNVPRKVSDEFFDKYGDNGKLSKVQASEKFMKEFGKKKSKNKDRFDLGNNLNQNLNDATAAMTRLVNTATAFTIKDSIPDLISAIIKETVPADLREKIKIN